MTTTSTVKDNDNDIPIMSSDSHHQQHDDVSSAAHESTPSAPLEPTSSKLPTSTPQTLPNLSDRSTALTALDPQTQMGAENHSSATNDTNDTNEVAGTGVESKKRQNEDPDHSQSPSKVKVQKTEIETYSRDTSTNTGTSTNADALAESKDKICNDSKKSTKSKIPNDTSHLKCQPPPPTYKKDGYSSKKLFNDNIWRSRYEELVRFQKQHGHCKVPQRYMPNIHLGRWVTRQRHYYKQMLEGKSSWMTIERAQQLEKIGFDSDILKKISKQRSSEADNKDTGKLA